MSVTKKLAKLIGVDVDAGRERIPTDLPAGAYVERPAVTKEFIHDYTPTAKGVRHYLLTLFPFLTWIHHYNLIWLMGDLIAGITVGFVVVPQGMAYALLANLPPEYGLYTSFVGFLLYWAFATSKDITIGTVAVMSTIVGNIVNKVQDEYPDVPAEEIARALALLAGAILLFIGLTRLGFIVELIPLVAITSFMTGAAISIAAGQVPGMMGIKAVNTRESTYLVIINTLKHLPDTSLDAAMGLTALVMLYLIRIFCSLMSKRYPNQSKTWFFISTLRMVFVILLYTLISWLANRGIKSSKEAKFSILGTVPSGFKHAGAPTLRPFVLSAIAGDLPTVVIVLIIEHIAISKSFGRVNNYIINPSQELVAVGFTNLLGPFLGGYPATGSFSRTAIKAKAGVRTPLAGVFTAVIVLLALYALTAVFFYIPKASLSGLIIHAVLDLITPPRTVYQYWKTSPFEVIIFFAGVFVAIFTNIENGIYVTVGLAAAALLWQIARSRGSFLGQVRAVEAPIRSNPETVKGSSDDVVRQAFAPLDHSDGVNSDAPLHSPYPGVFVYRFNGGFNYLNSALHFDTLSYQVHQETRQTEANKYEKKGVSVCIQCLVQVYAASHYQNSELTCRASRIAHGMIPARVAASSRTNPILDPFSAPLYSTSPPLASWTPRPSKPSSTRGTNSRGTRHPKLSNGTFPASPTDGPSVRSSPTALDTRARAATRPTMSHSTSLPRLPKRVHPTRSTTLRRATRSLRSALLGHRVQRFRLLAPCMAPTGLTSMPTYALQ
jgi:sodium-independent sulfate anion transporter 11